MISFDWVVGADGAGSMVREAIVRLTGGSSHAEMLDHGYKEFSIPAGPRGEYQMERHALHVWPRGGFMLIALPNLDATFTVTLFLPHRGHPGFEELSASPDRVESFFLDEFPDAWTLMPAAARDFFAHPTGELGTVRCWPWTDGKTALLVGDAAHAIVPFHGQGMNAGFEDCIELAHLLDAADHEWSSVAERFAQQRKPNADAIAQMALENYIDMRDTTRSSDFVLRKELGFELERHFPNRFVPRYSLVMFHRVPYTEALRRGAVQDEILDALLAEATRPGKIDYQLAERLIYQRLEPLPSMAGQCAT
jgi:kynurenine 3-monooxygenase